MLISYWGQLSHWIRYSLIVFTASVSLVGFGLFWLLRYPDFTLGIPSGNANTNLPWAPRIKEAIQGLWENLKTIDEQQNYRKIWSITIGIWLFVYTNFYFVVRSTGESPLYSQMIVISIIMLPLELIPIQGFANLGTHEIGWTAAFALFGYSTDLALNIAISSHVIMLSFALLIGLIGYTLVTLKINSLT